MSGADEPRVRLIEAPWRISPDAQAIFTLLEGEAGRTRAVGGVVRDTLLDRARSQPDVDLATELPPEAVIARAEAAGIAAYPTGIAHGTVTLKLGDFLAEVTTLREDIETDGRHAIVRFGTDWQRDAERRDFTMNALYAGMDGTLFDPLGGLEDLLAGRVRFVGDPDRRIAEDRLRVYRFFRFAAGYGAPFAREDPGFAACARAVRDLGQLSPERVGAEMKRLLSLPRIGWVLELMAAIGLVPLSADALAALARYEISGQPRFAGRLAVWLDMLGVDAVKRDWRLSNADLDAAGAIVAALDLIADGRIEEAIYRHPEALEDAARLLALRSVVDPEAIREQLAAAAKTTPPHLPVAGGDLVRLGFAPGPALGRELRRLERLWIDSGFALERHELLSLARRPA